MRLVGGNIPVGVGGLVEALKGPPAVHEHLEDPLLGIDIGKGFLKGASPNFFQKQSDTISTVNIVQPVATNTYLVREGGLLQTINSLSEYLTTINRDMISHSRRSGLVCGKAVSWQSDAS
jgi:hypothetical protein